MHPRQGLSPALRERLRTRIGSDPPCACIRSAGRVHMCLALRARDQSQRAFARAGTESARAPSRACRERDLASAHRAREAPMRTHPRRGRAGVCVRAPAHEGARSRAPVCLMHARSRARARARIALCDRARVRDVPSARGRPIACKGLRGMRASVCASTPAKQACPTVRQLSFARLARTAARPMGAAVQSVARHPRCYRTLPYGASVYSHIRSGCDIAWAQERDPVFVGGPDADRERAVRERFEPRPGRAPPRYAGSRSSRLRRLRALGISHGFAHRVLARKRLRIA